MKHKWLARFLAAALVVSALQQSESIVSAVAGADAVEASDEAQMPGETENMQVPEMEEESPKEVNVVSIGERENLESWETGGSEWTVEAIEPWAGEEYIAEEDAKFPEVSKEQDTSETIENSETGESAEATEEVQETERVEAIGVPEAAEESAENENALVAYAADDITGGSYEDIVWTIDAGGKLTVNGTGECSGSGNPVPWYEYRDKIITAEISMTGTTDVSYMFSECTSLTNVDLSNFDTSNVIDMSHMFFGCTNLTNLDLSNFDTANVTNMSMMFYGCNNLTDLDLSSFDTSNVTDMSYMFGSCSSLVYLDVSQFNTVNVTDMQAMFSSCPGLINLDVSHFNTVNVTNMSAMFTHCLIIRIR